MDDYNLFKTYIAMKSHFTTEAYDYMKYGGKVSISETAYQKRKDIASFKIVAGWLPQKHCESLLVSHFIEMNDFTIPLAKQVLETCIDILGFSAPEKM